MWHHAGGATKEGQGLDGRNKKRRNDRWTETRNKGRKEGEGAAAGTTQQSKNDINGALQLDPSAVQVAVPHVVRPLGSEH